VERDHEVNAALDSMGWHVVRLLESEIRRNTTAAADTIEAIVRSAG
jgi:very-short-patch-repair endonuclease